MTNETSYREKGRAVFLTAMMVLSVVAMSAAFVGGAAAAENNRYEDGIVVEDGDTIYQGEDDLTFADSFSTTLTGAESGGAAGQTLDTNLQIPEDQETGIYTGSNDKSVTVTQPRVADIIAYNLDSDGNVISDAVDGSSISTEDAEHMRINVKYNFEQA